MGKAVAGFLCLKQPLLLAIMAQVDNALRHVLAFWLLLLGCITFLSAFAFLFSTSVSLRTVVTRQPEARRYGSDRGGHWSRQGGSDHFDGQFRRPKVGINADAPLVLPLSFQSVRSRARWWRHVCIKLAYTLPLGVPPGVSKR